MGSNSRRIIIVGNWKMYKTVPESIHYIQTLLLAMGESTIKTYLAVPFTAIHPLAVLCKNTPITIGAQNMHDAEEGAFTGEIAARMLKDAGAHFVILGHSERRRLFHETSSFINKKVKRALSAGLIPLLCVGETLAQREADETKEVLMSQIKESLEGITREQVVGLALAYEPVWAIGTSQVATPKMAQEAHLICRHVLKELFGADVADQISILYGGSVSPASAPGLLEQPDVDGLLVGGASLDPQSFLKIIQDAPTNHLNINR